VIFTLRPVVPSIRIHQQTFMALESHLSRGEVWRLDVDGSGLRWLSSTGMQTCRSPDDISSMQTCTQTLLLADPPFDNAGMAQRMQSGLWSPMVRHLPFDRTILWITPLPCGGPFKSETAADRWRCPDDGPPGNDIIDDPIGD
jgi:hypothetical protein